MIGRSQENILKQVLHHSKHNDQNFIALSTADNFTLRIADCIKLQILMNIGEC